MQTAHTSALTSLDLDQEFESCPLRHAVWSAEKSAVCSRQNREKSPQFREFSFSNRTREIYRLGVTRGNSGCFLWWASEQSGFRRPARRMEYDEKAINWRMRFDFSRALVFTSATSQSKPAIIASGLPVVREKFQ